MKKTKTNKKPAMPEKPPHRGGGWEGVSSYGFAELAQMYYPDRGERSAIRLFREEMHLTRGLWEAMTAVGYKPYTKVLTRGQVKTIVQFLGEP